MRRRALLATVNNNMATTDVNNYLTIVALEDGLTVSLSINDIEYCVDSDWNWKTLPAATKTESINYGQLLSFRGNLTPNSSGIGTFTINKSCDLIGNCMSLLFGDDAKSNNSLNGKNYAFYNLFKNCKTIKNVTSKFLPATTLANRCYTNMFYGCTSLVNAPELPATTLTTSCYSNMFRGCTSLVNAPELPSTTLADHCYNAMFYGCTSLVNAPKLPATTLAGSCYYYMFRGCTSLVNAPELPATTLTTSCYVNMFNGCTILNYIKAMFTTTPSGSYTSTWVLNVASSGTFVKNKNATWDVTGTSGIPSGWTIIKE